MEWNEMEWNGIECNYYIRINNNYTVIRRHIHVFIGRSSYFE